MHDNPLGNPKPIPVAHADNRFTNELIRDVRNVLEAHGYPVSTDVGVIEITCHLSHLLHGCGDHCHGHTLDGD